MQPVASGANYPSDRLDPPLLNDNGSGRCESSRRDDRGRQARYYQGRVPDPPIGRRRHRAHVEVVFLQDGTRERVPVGPQRQESGQPRGTALEEAKRRVEQAEERAASELRLRLEAERREAQLRAELGRRAEGVAPAASTPAQSRGMPADERALIAAAEKGRAAFETGANEMAKGAARPARARDICATFASSLRAVNWIGKVASLSSNGEGKGVLAVEISPGVHIKTFNNSFSDMSSNTLIQPGTGLHAKAVALSPGQQVVFSGTFFRSETDCINEVSLTIRGSMEIKPEAREAVDGLAPPGPPDCALVRPTASTRARIVIRRTVHPVITATSPSGPALNGLQIDDIEPAASSDAHCKLRPLFPLSCSWRPAAHRPHLRPRPRWPRT